MNKKQKNLISIFLIGAAVLSMLAGCGKKAENEPEQIRVMTPGNYLPIIIADKKGFFKEAFGENVNVEVTAADSGSAIMETMTSGGVEFAALGDMPVVQAKANGLDVKVISSLFRSTSGYQLIAAKDSGIKNISDIRGKRVAVMSGSTNHKLLLKYLGAEHLTEDDIDIVSLKNKDQLAAFVGNTVDAAVTQVPTSTAIEAETGAYEVADAEGYDDILTVIVGDDAYMKDHPEHARQFLQAVLAATDWIKDNEEEAFSVVAKEMGDTSENIALYYNTRTFEYELDAGVSDALDDTISYLYEQGTIKNRPDVADLTDATYLDAVRKEQP